MNVKRDITVAALALSLIAGVAMATTTESETQPVGQGPGYGMMNGQGQQKGFGGQGMRGKRLQGGDQECWRANGGPGMGKKAMMGRGHRQMMMNPEMREKRDAFLDATKDLRKEMMEKRFAYKEAQRNPEVTVGQLQKQEKELYELRTQIQAKRAEFFTVEKAE